MATKIYNTDTKEIVELSVISDGQDFIGEVIGQCNTDGMFYAEDMPETAEFAMDAESVSWWERWAEREQAILDKANEVGEEAIQAICDLANEYDDMELLQDKEEEYLGI